MFMSIYVYSYIERYTHMSTGNEGQVPILEQLSQNVWGGPALVHIKSSLGDFNTQPGLRTLLHPWI